MKLTFVYVIALVALSASEVLSASLKREAKTSSLATRGKHEVKNAKHEVPSTLKKEKKKEKTKTKEKKGKDDHSSGFCDGKTLSDGKQISGGSCSLTVQGDIPSSEKMTSTLIISPENGEVLTANKAFDVDVLVENLDTGHFSNPETEYNSKPQTLNHGLIEGHSHITIQKLISKHKPPCANKFEFFKGLEAKDKKGLLTATVIRQDNSTGLEAGAYRICTMAGSFTHQPLVMPVAKRGAQDDCIRITVKNNGKGEEKGKEVKGGKGEISLEKFVAKEVKGGKGKISLEKFVAKEVKEGKGKEVKGGKEKENTKEE